MTEHINPTLPFNLTTLTAAMDRGQGAFDMAPDDLLVWIRTQEETIVLNLLIQIVLSDRPGISPNALTVALTLNPYQAIHILLSHVSVSDSSQQYNVLLMLQHTVECWFITSRLHRPHFPPTHPIIQILLQLLANPYTAQRALIVMLISRLGASSVFDTLLPYCKRSDTDIYITAVTGLIALDTERALPIIHPLSQSDDESLRWWICYELAQHPTVLALDLVLDRLQTDPSSGVRVEASSTLGVIGHPRAIPALTQAALTDSAVDNHGHTVQEIAARAIVGIILNGFVELNNSDTQESLDPEIAVSFVHVRQDPHLHHIFHDLQQHYGTLLAVTPIHYWRGDDPYTHFNALGDEFGIRACFSYEQQDVYFNIDLQRIHHAWIINDMHLCETIEP